MFSAYNIPKITERDPVTGPFFVAVIWVIIF